MKKRPTWWTPTFMNIPVRRIGIVIGIFSAFGLLMMGVGFFVNDLSMVARIFLFVLTVGQFTRVSLSSYALGRKHQLKAREENNQ